MEQKYINEQAFDKVDFRENYLPKGEYENCIFRNCDFSNSDLSNIKFVECEFIACNLSMVRLNQTALKGVKFRDCKMLGFRFDNCADFLLSVGFDNCSLNFASFYKTKMKKTVFKDSQLRETDFSECNLTDSVFENCDLMQASFNNTTMERTDFRTSYNYTIDPEKNRMKKARFSLSGVAGLLDKYDIEID